MKEIIAYGIIGIAAYALSILFVGGTVRRVFLRDKWLFWIAGACYVVGWWLFAPLAIYASLRRMFMLRWMAQRYQSCSRMNWADSYHAAVTQFEQSQQWGDLSLFPTPEWNRNGAYSLADDDMECWDGD